MNVPEDVRGILTDALASYRWEDAGLMTKEERQRRKDEWEKATAWLDSLPAAPEPDDMLPKYIPEYEEFALGAVQDAIQQAFWAGVESGREKMQEEFADLAQPTAPEPDADDDHAVILPPKSSEIVTVRARHVGPAAVLVGGLCF